jgi:hypothetical protein
MASRSHDDGLSIRDYLAQIDVICSRCANHAIVRMSENPTDIDRPVFPA